MRHVWFSPAILFIFCPCQYDSPSSPSSPELPRRWRQSSEHPLLLYDHSEPSSCRRRSPASTRSSPISPSRGCYQDRDSRTISPALSEEEPENNLFKATSSRDQDRHDHESHRGLVSRSTSPKTPPLAKSAKGKEREAASSELAMTFSRSNQASFSTQDKGAISAESPERVRLRPPRRQSLLETVKGHLAKNGLAVSRDTEPAPTGSRRKALLADPDAPSLLSRLSDPQTPSIVLSAASGDGGRPSPEKFSAALDTMEARARLLARLNREKRLHVYESSNSEHTPSEPTTHGSVDLEANRGETEGAG